MLDFYTATFIGFLVGMITGSIIFHFTGNNRNNSIRWIAGIIPATIVGAVAEYILVYIFAIHHNIIIVLGAIGGL